MNNSPYSVQGAALYTRNDSSRDAAWSLRAAEPIVYTNSSHESECRTVVSRAVNAQANSSQCQNPHTPLH